MAELLLIIGLRFRERSRVAERLGHIYSQPLWGYTIAELLNFQTASITIWLTLADCYYVSELLGNYDHDIAYNPNASP